MKIQLIAWALALPVAAGTGLQGTWESFGIKDGAYIPLKPYELDGGAFKGSAWNGNTYPMMVRNMTDAARRTPPVLNVTVPESDTSYLIVALTPSYDDEFLSEQRSALSQRARHNFGFRLMVASAVPFVTSAVSAIVASNSIDKANEKKRLVEQSLFHDSESYNHNLERYGDYRDRAETARTLSIDMLIAGAALLGIGVVLSF